jgi:hypothetical protein
MIGKNKYFMEGIICCDGYYAVAVTAQRRNRSDKISVL